MSQTSEATCGGPAATFDPLRYCIFSTVALLARALGPGPVMVAVSILGIAAYAVAWRAGLKVSRCLLRDPRLVIAYLVGILTLGVVVTISSLSAFVY